MDMEKLDWICKKYMHNVIEELSDKNENVSSVELQMFAEYIIDFGQFVLSLSEKSIDEIKSLSRQAEKEMH
jgi:hypothetical protein